LWDLFVCWQTKRTRLIPATVMVGIAMDTQEVSKLVFVGLKKNYVVWGKVALIRFSHMDNSVLEVVMSAPMAKL